MFPDRSGPRSPHRLCAVLALLAVAAPAHAASTRAKLLSKMTDWSGAPSGAVVSVTADTVVAVTRRGVPGAGGEIDGVEIIGEIADDGLAQTRGWRSMRTTLDVSCADRAIRIDRMEVFPEHGQQGAGRPAAAPKGWAQPSVGAYLADVVTVVCFSGPAPSRRTTVARAATPAPAPAPAPPVPPPSSPTPSPAAAAPGPVVATPPRAGGPVAQIASAPSKEEAQAALDALAGRAPVAPPLATRIELVTIRGRFYDRAEVVGFSSVAEARTFCAKVRTAGGECFVR
jgi:hypothetical protein